MGGRHRRGDDPGAAEVHVPEVRLDPEDDPLHAPVETDRAATERAIGIIAERPGKYPAGGIAHVRVAPGIAEMDAA